MFRILLRAVWLLLPAAAANAAPVVAAKLFPKLSYPVDCGFAPGGIRLFGSHKTFRGILSGLLAGSIIGYEEELLAAGHPFMRSMSPWGTETSGAYIGLCLGFGALAGDLAKSFLKRRMDIPPGTTWFPFDEVDWIIGALLVSAFFVRPALFQVIACLFVGISLHLTAKLIGYLLGLEKAPL